MKSYEDLMRGLRTTLGTVAHRLNSRIIYPNRTIITLPELANLIEHLKASEATTSMEDTKIAISLSISDLKSAGDRIINFILATTKEAYNSLLTTLEQEVLPTLEFQTRAHATYLCEQIRNLLTAQNLLGALTRQNINEILTNASLLLSLQEDKANTPITKLQRDMLKDVGTQLFYVIKLLKNRKPPRCTQFFTTTIIATADSLQLTADQRLC
jgi:hypothetical protein